MRGLSFFIGWTLGDVLVRNVIRQAGNMQHYNLKNALPESALKRLDLGFYINGFT